MARFELVDKKNINHFRGSEFYVVRGSITNEDVQKINKVVNDVVLIFENTKGQNSEIIKGINSPNVKLSIMGGVDYLKKQKYNNVSQINATIYKPSEMSAIIKKFEELERGIEYTWTPLEKAMYVYKKIVEAMHYEVIYDYDERDRVNPSRNLRCLFYTGAVCRGFALLYKEAMDRLGIECIYQNKSKAHCWNALRINGDYYLLDLTWDVCKKKDNVCTFSFFGKEKSDTFYKKEPHDISDEIYELSLPATTIDEKTLDENLEVISKQKYTYSGIMTHYKNDKGEEFDYYMFKDFGLHKLYIVEYGGKIDYFYCRRDDDIRKYLDNKYLNIVNLSYNHNVNREDIEYLKGRIMSYERDDKSSFIVLKGNKTYGNSIKEYCIIETCNVNNEKRLRRVTILSENDLTEKSDNYKYDNYIANWLLGKKRLNKKVEQFNGYVGYIKNRDKVYNIFYDKNFEQNKLNILNRN